MSEDARLALVFDDGYAEDYESVYPTLDDLGVPATVAITPSRIGEEGHLTVGQLTELADAGWEVAAHGREHRYLQAMGLAAPANAGDRRIPVDDHHVFPGEDHGLLPGDEIEVTDGDRRFRSEVRGIATRDGGDVERDDSEKAGYVVTLTEPLDAGFDPRETVVRPAPPTLRDEVRGAARDLAAMGFDPRTFVFPYDAADPRAWRLASDEYAVLANAAVRSLPNPPGTDPTNLRRWYLETDHLTRVECREYLDHVATEGGMGILAGHAAWDTVTLERVRFVVEAALERGIEVATLGTAADRSSDR